MDYLQIANSVPLWIAAGLGVALVLFQSILFARKSISAGSEMGITGQQMRSAMKSSFITSIGPSVAILTALLVLMVSLGSPVAWMRLSFIGSMMFEMMAAGFGTGALGQTLGVDAIDNVAFANALWTMALGSIGWTLVSVLTADKMDKAQKRLTKGDPGLMKVISAAALVGAFGALLPPHLLSVNRNTVAALAGAGIMTVMILISKKHSSKTWLKEWSLAIALFGGMIVAALV